MVEGTAVEAETAEVVLVGGTTAEAMDAGTASEAVVVGPATMASGDEEDSKEESEETVSEMRSKDCFGEAGPVVEPEVRPVDPLIAQFGEDDG